MKSSSKTTKQYINLYFQVHQPRRLNKFRFFDIGSDAPYFNDALNESIMKRIALECYLPANKMLLRIIKKNPKVRITFSISGVALEQLHDYAPEVLKTFRMLAATGAVEFLGETYYHSLSSLNQPQEFVAQTKKHHQKIQDLLGVEPAIFRNTELVYSNVIGEAVNAMGFRGMYTEGIESLLKKKPVNKTYSLPGTNFVLFLRNYKLSDDIAFRFSDRKWSQWPLTSDKFITWLKGIPREQDFISIGMDYETFGEHHKSRSGIFRFLEQLITAVARSTRFRFMNPTEAAKRLKQNGKLSIEKTISWADQAKDISAWLGNDLQRDAFDSMLKLYPAVMNSLDMKLINAYNHLQTSDHFYYMSTKKNEDGSVHQYFSPYSSPYEAYMNYMNVLADLEMKTTTHKENRSSDSMWVSSL